MTEMTQLTPRTRREGSRAQEDDIFDQGMFRSVMKAAGACDKFFNCAYVKKQLEDEWKQEVNMHESAVGRVWNRMDKSLEVEAYRQFLFDESSVCTEGDSQPEAQSQAQSNSNRMASLLFCGDDREEIMPALQRSNT